MMRLVCIYQGGGDSDFFGRLQSEMDSRVPGEFLISSYDCYALNDSQELLAECFQKVEEADFTLMDIHGGLPYFKGFLVFQKRFIGREPMFIRSGIEDEVTALMDQLRISIQEYAMIERYIQAGGTENYCELCKWTANHVCHTRYEVKVPHFAKWQCLYTPEGPVGDEAAYLLKVRTGGKPVIGVILHENQMRREDLSTADALYDAILARGAQPLVLVTNILPPNETDTLGFADALRHYMTEDGKPAVHAIINTTGMSVSVLSSPGDGSAARAESVFELTGVPVFQGMQTYHTYDQWLISLAGLDAMMLSCCVYQPEFDGQIITYPVCTRESVPTSYGSKFEFHPIAERVGRIVDLAVNWARLRQIRMEEKRVAIVLHNMPPRNDSIGCAFGLDTPASVYQMVQALAGEGLRLQYGFKDGKDIIERIIAGLTNDGRWLPEEEMLKRSADTVSGTQYRTWFHTFGAKVQEKMTEDWGEAPGEFMTVEDQILIPGIRNGNLFIGLQPPRAFEEKAEQCYHSTDMVCPHQYLAYYKWIEHVFRADVIVHVGTHGTLEWLPGKEIGLSADCYPDMAIGSLPHLYVYNISVTGEGMQAKRRSYAALIGHMVPSMTPSGVYGDLAEMDDLIDDYYHARQGDPGRMGILYDQLWELVQKLHLDQDLEVGEKPEAEGMDGFVARIHLWISRIKESETRDGLHILGQVPEGKRFSNCLRLLTRVRNGEIPSLREALCALKGWNADALMDHPERMLPDGRTQSMVLNEIDELGQQMFEVLRESDYSSDAVKRWIRQTPGENAEDKLLNRYLEYVCGPLRAALEQTSDELVYFMRGVRGEFQSPGPSGNPSRGNAHILPTGKNFYAMDPGAIPSRTAWRVGQSLAEQLLDREKKSTGKLPESIAIVIYAGDTMKTCGDDLGEVLYLMGVRPVWLSNTDRVIGLEVIPLTELGRPRIDVTLRISGLFRDTFPNLIERIEDAVNLVAALDEPRERNYLRKHIDEEVAQMRTEGMADDQAFERASARIFGCPPGTYGAGVDLLINSRKWETSDDLGNIYIKWSGHAYGRKLHGAAWQDQLKTRLSKTTVTVKNVPSVEMDMLDSDDFYAYHGGLIAAVHAAGGEMPSSYSASTADIGHVETLNLHEETSRIMRSRINNPKWLEGLKQHGYKGAQEISAMVDIVFGWDATSNNIDKWMYDQIAENFVLNAETRKWIREVNPWAMHAMCERLLEANKRGMWQADADTLQQLRDIYMEAEGGIEEIL